MEHTPAPGTFNYEPLLTQLVQYTDRYAGYFESTGKHADTPYELHSPNWYRDMRTVHMGGPRQTGKTYWLLSQITPTTGILVTNERMQQELLAASNGALRPDQVLTPKNITHPDKYPSMPLYPFTTFIVDDASYTFERVDRRAFYKWVVSRVHPHCNFVMLG